MRKYRVVIVGAGVVGASVARVLTMFEDFNVVIVEKEPDVGWGVSKANTSIIHPGHEEDPSEHPLRARLCVEGNKLWRVWCDELDIPARWVGELMVFTNDEEEREALKYVELARRNGVPEVRVIYRDELLKMEPIVSKDALGAIYAGTAGIISPFEAVVAIIENAVDNGAKLLTETEVRGVKVVNGEVKGVVTSRGFIEADIVVNAAGLYADEVSHMAGVELNFRIRPRRGQYLVFDESVPKKPYRILHTTPTPITKGVYVIQTVEGALLVGPTAEDLPYEAKDEVSTTHEGLNYLMEQASKLINELPPKNKLIRTFAGLRPEPPNGKWLIRAYTDPWGFINVAGMRSPGLTAAPAIAYYVLKLITREYGIKPTKKRRWRSRRVGIRHLRDLSLGEIDSLIRRDPNYGEVVCVCRMVSKAEVLEAIDRILRIGARPTIDGVKFRTTAGFGRCQGSRCRWLVASLIAERLGVELDEVLLKESPYVMHHDIKAILKGVLR